MSSPKYIIGLTGNIATGKSEVLKMLARLGATVIDADALAHRAMAKDTPVWRAVVKEFGEGILGPEGEIDRLRLGEIVFADPKALRRLEEIVHPAVIAATAEPVRAAEGDVVAVEAIKLIEAGMRYDALWVVTCGREQQLARLMAQRGLSEEEARRRIEAQPPQEEKLALADVVIDNSGSLEETWEQVKAAWDGIQRSKR